MAPADRNPNRRPSLMPASESQTSRDEVEATRIDRSYMTTERTDVGRPDTSVTPPDRMSSDELTRRLDVSENPRFAPEPTARRLDPRTTDIFTETPDVIGAPERTVVAPLPPRHIEVEPIPDAASTNGARIAAEAEERRAKRAREDAMREEALRREEARRRDEKRRADPRRDESRRERVEARATDKEVALEPALRNPAKERTQPAVSIRDAERQRSQRRRDPTDEDEPIPTDEIIHSPTRIERVSNDSPWSRLGSALREVSHALVVSTKEGWQTLRREGVRPFLDKAKPRVVQGWHKVRELALRMRLAAVAKAAEMGLVKPKRLNEFEQQGDDQLNHSRVEAWRRFNKGKTSSSYLQDDE